MLGFIALIIVVALVGGCAVAFGSHSRADINIERRIEVDPSVNVDASIDPKEKRK